MTNKQYLENHIKKLREDWKRYPQRRQIIEVMAKSFNKRLQEIELQENAQKHLL